MQIVVIAALMVSLMLVKTAPGDLMPPSWLIAPAVAVYLLGAAGMRAGGTVLALRALTSRKRPEASRRRGITPLLVNLWLVLGLGGLVVLGYGRWIMDETALGLGGLPLVGELAVMAPFVVALLVDWALSYPYYRAVRMCATGRPCWSAWQYLVYNCRHHLLFVLVPVGLIILIQDSLFLYAKPDSAIGQAATHAALLASTVGVFLVAPMMIVRIWKTSPMPATPMRREMEAMCSRFGLRYRDIRVWRSDGVIANAGVMGLAGPLRYILISDALVDGAPIPCVRAIFAHELGHIVHRHILHAVLFAVSAIVLTAAAGETLGRALSLDRMVMDTVTLGVLAGAFGFGFGWISRRFERQSDVFAAWAVGGSHDDGRITPEGAALFAKSLETVAYLNGIQPRQGNWRHGSIAHRIGHILWLGTSGGTRKRIDRVVRRIKIALWIAAGVSGALIALALRQGWI